MTKKRKHIFTRLLEIATIAILLFMILVPTCQRWNEYRFEKQEQEKYQEYMRAHEEVLREIQANKERGQ